MTLAVKTDSSWPGGGFALLSGDGLEGVTAVTIENCLSKLLLDARGQWGKFPHPFPVEQTPSGALLMGPDIVDHVPTELFILLRDQAGAELGRLFWADVMPSRNPGSATPADVLAIHRRGIVSDAPKPEPPPAPPGIELATATVTSPSPPPPPGIELAQPPPPPLPQQLPEPEATILSPKPVIETDRQADPVIDRSPPPTATRTVPDTVGRGETSVLRLPDGSTALLPLWMTITLGGVFGSSLLIVAAIFAGFRGF